MLHPSILAQVRKHCFVLSLLIAFLVSLSQIASSQNKSALNPLKRPSQYILNSWNTEDGLTSESTNDLIQTDDGYIWIGTYTGLHRFDGNNMTVFTAQNSLLPSANVLRMDIDSEGVLWLGTLHGVCTYSEGKFHIPEALKPVADYSIETIKTSQKGDVWFSTKSNHLFLFKDNQLENLTQTFNLEKSTVLTIDEAPDGTIYIGTDDSRLLSYYKGQIKQHFFNGEINGVFKIVSNPEQVYIGTGKGLYVLRNNVLSKKPHLQNTAIYSLLEDQNGTLWIGTMGGLFRYQPTREQLDSLTEEHGLPNNIIRDILFDKQGNLWGGTYRNGIFLLSDGSLTSYTKNDGLNSNIITGVTQLGEDNYLLGNENGVLNQLNHGQISEYKPEISLPNARLKHLFTDSHNRVWASTYGGLILLDGKNSREYTINTGFPDNFVRQVYEDYQGHIWVGTKNAGLIKFVDKDTWEILDSEKGMTSNYIMSIAENSNNQLIVGTISGINVIEDMTVVKTIGIDDGLPSNFSFATYPGDHYLWIASNDGLIAYSEDKTVVFNTEKGMPFDIVYSVMGDKYGNLWMPGEKAILRVGIEDLERAIEQPNEKITFQQFDRSHGMANNHCLGGVHSFMDKSEHMWIPTQGGVVHVNALEIKTYKLDANIILENIFADNTPLELNEVVLFPASANRLRVTFSGIDYKNTDKLQFRYQLFPFDKEWITTSSQRNAQYTNLPPGQYEFLLQVGMNNTFSEPGITKKILIKAAWWQMIWAKIVLALAILSFAFFIYLLRVKALRVQNKKLETMVTSRTMQLEQQKEELTVALSNLSTVKEQVIHSEKMASLGVLAAGIAHEMNNPLNFIQGGLFGLEQHYIDNESEPSDDVNSLLNAIKEGIDRASAIVSSLNEFSHQGENNTEECHIHHILDNCLIMMQYKLFQNIELIKEYTDEEPVVSGNNGKLHQSFINILTNAVQAMADKKGTLSIRTRSSDQHVVVEVTDTGSGIQAKDLKRITEPFYTTKAPGEGTGLGLSITYSIIKDHGGDLSFASKTKEGTTVTITLPLI